MANFAFEARDSAGKLIKGTIESNSAENVAAQLIGQGNIPLRIIEESRATKNKSNRYTLHFSKIKIDDLIMFCRQMYFLTKAGVPIIIAVQQLTEILQNPQLVRALKQVAKQLTLGESLSSAFASHPKIFSKLLLALVAAGEANGRLDEAFLQASYHYETENTTIRQVKAALRYPAFIVIALAAAMVILNLFVIPRFAQLYLNFQATLPLPTRILLGTSNFMRQEWIYLLIIIVLAIVGVRYLFKQAKVALWWDQHYLQLPIVGSILDRTIMASFSKTLSTLLRTGVSLTQSLTLVGGVVDNTYARKKILALREKIERGQSLSQAAREAKFFSPLVLQMLVVGEQTGNTDTMLFEVGEFYERELSYEIKRLTDKIEPILLIGVGAMVLVFALGVFLPMWDLVYAIK